MRFIATFCKAFGSITYSLTAILDCPMNIISTISPILKFFSANSRCNAGKSSTKLNHFM